MLTTYTMTSDSWKEFQLYSVDAGDWLVNSNLTSIKPSQKAINLLAEQLCEFNGETGRHLTVYGLSEFFGIKGLDSEAMGEFLDEWAMEAYRLHSKHHRKQVSFFTANRPLGGIQGSMGYIKSFIPESRQQSELEDIQRGLRYQSLILHRDISNYCNFAGVSKKQYLAQSDKIIDDSIHSVKIPHLDAGTTISILSVYQENVRGGRSQIFDLRNLLRYLNQTRKKKLNPLDLLAPVRKQGTYQDLYCEADVVLGLKPQFQKMIDDFTITIPEPNKAVTFFINDLFDRITKKFSGILHGAEPPVVLDELQPRKRHVSNRAVFAKIIGSSSQITVK